MLCVVVDFFVIDYVWVDGFLILEGVVVHDFF